METHLEGTNNGGSYRGYNVWRPIKRVQCMQSHIGYKVLGQI